MILLWNPLVKPVCLPRQGESMETLNSDVVGEEIGENNLCYVAGWGYREEGAYSSLPTILQG